MNEILGSIFGYNYRRRILINLRKKRNKLRERNLLKLKQKRALLEKKKKEQAIISGKEKEKELELEVEVTEEVVEEKEVEEIVPIDKNIKEKEITKVEEVIPPKEEKLDLPKIEENLEITKEQLLLIEILEEKYGLNPDDAISGLIDEILVSIEIIKKLEKKKELTEEEKDIVRDIKNDDLLDSIIQEEKKEITFCVNDKTTSIDDLDDDFDKYKDELEAYLKKSGQDIRDISNMIKKDELNVETRRRYVRGGLRTATVALLVASIASRRNPVVRRVTGRMFRNSLRYDLLNPRRRVIERRTEILPDAELEACRKDIDYARLSILDWKKFYDDVFFELDRYKDIEEYKESYDEIYKELESLYFELEQEEYELDKMDFELQTDESYIPDVEEEVLFDDNDMSLYQLLRPRNLRNALVLARNINP